MKYSFKKRNFKKSLMTGITIMSLGFQLVPFSTVNAAADRTKPVIKMNGKQKITVELNQKIKIPKTTAKDNVDGNITKKITLKLSAPGLKSKQKKAIIKNIKKNKKVSFTKAGKYTITYTVKDLAGNKSVKKRYINVVNPKKEEKTTEVTNATTENITTEITTEVTTEMTTEVQKNPEKITSEENKTETPSTEKVTSEEKTTEENDKPAKEKKISFGDDGVVDYSDFNPDEIEVNGEEHTVISDKDFKQYIYDNYTDVEHENITINVENKINKVYLDYNSPMAENCNYLKFFGKISATDSEGNDISENIVIYEPATFESNSPDSDAISDRCIIYCTDDKGNIGIYNYYLSFRSNEEYLASKFTKVNDDPFVYVSYKDNVAENKNTNSKVLVMKKPDLYMSESRKNQV